MNRHKLGKNHFLEVAVAIAIAMVFIMPVSSMIAESISADTMIIIEPTMQMVKKGDTFTISIYVVPSEPVICVNVGNLSFNPSLIHANAVTEGDLFDPYETFTPGSINNVAGNIAGIEGAATPSNTTSDTGILCNISFIAQEEIGMSVLDIEDVVVTNTSGITISIAIDDGSVIVIAWLVRLNFNEYSGKSDYVIFGEIHDANDGPPADIYDSGKPPAPPYPPYIRAWFDDNLPIPDNFLWEDYRHYPDTYKIWDLYIQWKGVDSTLTNVTISWDNSTFYGCEYDFVDLMWYNDSNSTWDFVIDMLVSNNYVYAPRYHSSGIWLKDHFQIITMILDISPPEIINMTLTPSDPIDTDVPYGWENISCTVIDAGVGINQVRLMVTNATATVEYLTANIPGTDVYYYNTTFTQPGSYSYHIWADDVIGNNATSAPQTFLLPANWEMNTDRICDISDLRKVALHFGETGIAGWIRADYTNDGECDISDLRKVALNFGDTY